MKKILICVMLSICSFAYGATGNELLIQLKSQNANDSLRAYAYIDGFVETDNLHLAVRMLETKSFEEFKKIRGAYLCIPEGVVKGQTIDLVRQYLENNPEQRHKNAALLIRNALLPIWGCGSQ